MAVTEGMQKKWPPFTGRAYIKSNDKGFLSVQFDTFVSAVIVKFGVLPQIWGFLSILGVVAAILGLFRSGDKFIKFSIF